MANKWLERVSQKSWIPMLNVTMIAGNDTCNLKQAKQYQELVGQLLWVSNTVQPDISFAVGVLARYMSTPTVSAWGAVIHALKYLNQTNQYQLQLGGNAITHADQPVVTYTDATGCQFLQTGAEAHTVQLRMFMMPSKLEVTRTKVYSAVSSGSRIRRCTRSPFLLIPPQRLRDTGCQASSLH